MKKYKTIILKKDNYKVTDTKTCTISDDEILDLFISKNHLCTSCSNLFNCSKVEDINKKTIDCYKFIRNGLQLYKRVKNKSGEYSYKDDKLLVTSCDNYVKELEREDDPLKREELMISILFYAFESDTLQGALDILNYDIKAGLRFDAEDSYKSRRHI